MTELSVEVLDHIFSFLVSHWKTLAACSKDPVFFPIAERHLYSHITVHFGRGEADSNHTFNPECLSRLLSKNPHIQNYVRELQIQFGTRACWPPKEDPAAKQQLDEFAKTLVMFPGLEYINLTTPLEYPHWQWADGFRAALEDRLELPSLKRLHLVGSSDFPSSLLEHCKNIKHLSLSGNFTNANVQVCGETLPQLKSLAFAIDDEVSLSVVGWLKLHIDQLLSMKCRLSPEGMKLLSELLPVCSPALSKLELDLRKSEFCSNYISRTGETMSRSPVLEFSPIPSCLRHLTIRTMVAARGESPGMDYWQSWLPAAVMAIRSFTPSLQHVVLDIDLYDISTFSEFTEVDFTPLLGITSLSIPRIDLYIHTGFFPPAVTRAQLLYLLEDDEDVVRLIKEGVLVIHSEKTAPETW